MPHSALGFVEVEQQHRATRYRTGRPCPGWQFNGKMVGNGWRHWKRTMPQPSWSAKCCRATKMNKTHRRRLRQFGTFFMRTPPPRPNKHAAAVAAEGWVCMATRREPAREWPRPEMKTGPPGYPPPGCFCNGNSLHAVPRGCPPFFFIGSSAAPTPTWLSDPHGSPDGAGLKPAPKRRPSDDMNFKHKPKRLTSHPLLGVVPEWITGALRGLSAARSRCKERNR